MSRNRQHHNTDDSTLAKEAATLFVESLTDAEIDAMGPRTFARLRDLADIVAPYRGI